MTSNKKQNKLYISILVMVVIIGIVYLSERRKSDDTPTQVIVQNTDLTSSWDTYRNTLYGFSIKFPATYEVKPGEEQQNNCIQAKLGNNGCVVSVNIYSNKDNLSLNDYLEINKKFTITGPLIKYDFNGYDSILNKNQPGTDVFIKQGVNVYHVVATRSSADKEIEDILATFKFN